MSAPYFDENGNLISSALQAQHVANAQNAFDGQTKMVEGQIIRVRPKKGDDKFTLYDILVRNADGATAVVPGARALQPLFGGAQNNFLEILPQDPGSRAGEAIERALKRGTMVLLGFVSGQATAPIIMGTLPHYSDRATQTRPTITKNALLDGEFQGLHFTITESGSFKLTFNGPRKDSGELKNANGPTAIEIDPKGNLLINNNNNQSIEISRDSDLVTVTSGPTSVVLDQTGNKIEVKAERIEIGDAALEPAVVGNSWVKIMTQLITALLNQTHPTVVGPTGTPINKQEFVAVQDALIDALSTKHVIEK
jgi:hypothetical protein